MAPNICVRFWTHIQTRVHTMFGKEKEVCNNQCNIEQLRVSTRGIQTATRNLLNIEFKILYIYVIIHVCIIHQCYLDIYDTIVVCIYCVVHL